MKKLICTALAVITVLMSVSVFPVSASETLSSGDFEYVINNREPYVIIMNYVGTSDEIVIPAEIDGYSVRTLHYDMLSASSTGIKKITIPETVLDIMFFSYASPGCDLETIDIHPDNPCYASVDGVAFDKQMQTLLCYPANNSLICNVPDGVKTIGAHAFDGARNLRTVTLPQSLETIEEYAFYGCSSLEGIVIPHNVTRILDNAFLECSSLADVTLSKNLVSIGDSAFAYCSLEKVVMYNKVSSIGTNAIRGSLHIYYTGSKTQWVDIDKSVTSVSGTMVYDYVPEESAVVRGTVTGRDDALITLSDKNGEILYSTVAVGGNFAFEKVPCGTYTVSSNSQAEYTSNSVEITAADVSTVDIETALLGDADNDGKVTIKDSFTLRQYIMGNIGEDGINKMASNVTGENSLSLKDVIFIRRFCLEIIEYFPIKTK